MHDFCEIAPQMQLDASQAGNIAVCRMLTDLFPTDHNTDVRFSIPCVGQFLCGYLRKRSQFMGFGKIFQVKNLPPPINPCNKLSNS